MQTEVVGEPAEAVTTIDLGGRVIKTMRVPCAGVRADLQHNASAAHREATRRLLALVSSRRGAASSLDETARLLFVLAVEAYDPADTSTTIGLLECVRDLLPSNSIVNDNLTRLVAS